MQTFAHCGHSHGVSKLGVIVQWRPLHEILIDVAYYRQINGRSQEHVSPSVVKQMAGESSHICPGFFVFFLSSIMSVSV